MILNETPIATSVTASRARDCEKSNPFLDDSFIAWYFGISSSEVGKQVQYFWYRVKAHQARPGKKHWNQQVDHDTWAWARVDVSVLIEAGG